MRSRNSASSSELASKAVRGTSGSLTIFSIIRRVAAVVCVRTSARDRLWELSLLLGNSVSKVHASLVNISDLLADIDIVLRIIDPVEQAQAGKVLGNVFVVEESRVVEILFLSVSVCLFHIESKSWKLNTCERQGVSSRRSGRRDTPPSCFLRGVGDPSEGL